jgi:hypothetical protein
MAKRTLPLSASVLIAAILFTVVAHACSAFSSIQTIVQAPCDHNEAQNETRGKPEKADCDSIRYGILSIKASSAQPDFSKLYSATSFAVVFVDLSLTGSLPSFRRSQAPPFATLPISPHRSHVVLRI